jgi:N-acetylglucosamine-6-phosphate deacetylase
MQFVDASRVLTPAGWTGPSRITVSGGVIESISPIDTAPRVTLAPGFVDLQVNGIDDVDVAHADGSDWDRLDAHLLAQGVTTWCPTIVTTRLERYAAPLARVAAAMQRSPDRRPSIAGVHLEGPFLGGAPGAHPPSLIIPIDLDWIRSLPPHVALMTLGAEQTDAVDATRALVADGRLVSIGHSTAAGAQFDAVVDAGARLTTHLFNGMSGAHHREPGVAVFAMTNPDVCASIIADGVHVHPRVVKLAFQALGRDRAVLVTDAVAWRAGHVGSIGMELRDGAPRLSDGTLAGSVVAMDQAIRVCVEAGVPLDEALTAASTTPARLLGLDDRGTIEVGRRADLVALDGHLAVHQVWIAGEPAGAVRAS